MSNCRLKGDGVTKLAGGTQCGPRLIRMQLCRQWLSAQLEGIKSTECDRIVLIRYGFPGFKQAEEKRPFVQWRTGQSRSFWAKLLGLPVGVQPLSFLFYLRTSSDEGIWSRLVRTWKVLAFTAICFISPLRDPFHSHWGCFILLWEGSTQAFRLFLHLCVSVCSLPMSKVYLVY